MLPAMILRTTNGKLLRYTVKTVQYVLELTMCWEYYLVY